MEFVEQQDLCRLERLTGGQLRQGPCKIDALLLAAR